MGTQMAEKSEQSHVCDYSFVYYYFYLTIVCSGSMCLDGQQLLITNLQDDVDRYSLPTMHRAQSYSHTILVNVPLQISVARESGWVIVGGDNGFARVFDYQTGVFWEKLDHGNGKCPLRLQV
jgi:hypothetical protein